MKRERHEYNELQNSGDHDNAKLHAEQHSTGPGDLVGRDVLRSSHFFPATSNKDTQRDLMHYAYERLCNHLSFLSVNDNHFGIVVDHLAGNYVNGYNQARTAQVRNSLAAKLQDLDDAISEAALMDYVTTLLDLAIDDIKTRVVRKFGEEALEAVLAVEHTKRSREILFNNMPADFVYYDTFLSALLKLQNVPCKHDLRSELENLVTAVDDCFYEYDNDQLAL